MPVTKIVELENAKKKLEFWKNKVKELKIETSNVAKRNKLILDAARCGSSSRSISYCLKKDFNINISHQGVVNIINENIKSI